MNRTTLFVMFVIVMFANLAATKETFKLNVELKHQGYEIVFDGKTLAYADGLLKSRITMNECNKGDSRLLVRQVKKLWQRQNITVRNPLPAIEVQLNGARKRVPFDSQFGQLLSSVPQRILTMEVQERKPCAINKKH